jgi:hypothetical protein
VIEATGDFSIFSAIQAINSTAVTLARSMRMQARVPRPLLA